MKNREFAKKRMMYIQTEDYNFLTYNLLILLYSLGCTDESKKFRDFRKAAYLIDFINSSGIITDFSENELANIYSKAQLKKQLISHLLIVLKNHDFIGISINTTSKTFDIWLNMENIPTGFFDKDLFKSEIANIDALKKQAHSLKTVPIKKLVDSIFTSNNIITWEI